MTAVLWSFHLLWKAEIQSSVTGLSIWWPWDITNLFSSQKCRLDDILHPFQSPQNQSMTKPFRLLKASSAPWTCQNCLLQKRFQAFKTKASYSQTTRPSYNKAKRRRNILLTASSAVAAGGLLLAPDARHYYEAAERSSRVATTLYACIREWEASIAHTISYTDAAASYKTTLKDPAVNEEAQISLLKACHKRCAERTLRALEKNGSIFIKLGQHLSSLGYLLPLEWTETFVPLQDKCPVSSYDSIEEMFLQDTGSPLSDMFETFEKEPIGSASLAQVHIATMKDTGKPVAVKVQHPSLDEWVPLDMALTKYSFSTLKRFFPEYDLEWLSDEMQKSLPQELDFATEGKNALRAREYFRGIPSLPLVIPDVMMGKRRILVMEYVAGKRLDDLVYLDDNGIDRDEVSATLARVFNEMIFGDGAPLHCDPHGGNIAIRKNDKRGSYNFELILYDHGLYRDIPKQLRRDYAKLWLAVINSDEKNMRKYAKSVANINDEQFPLFASAITGRDYKTATTSITSTRTAAEKEEISSALGEGLIEQVIQLLGQVPRIILLILKTNDLSMPCAPMRWRRLIAY